MNPLSIAPPEIERDQHGNHSSHMVNGVFRGLPGMTEVSDGLRHEPHDVLARRHA